MPFRWPWAKAPEQRSISFQDLWSGGHDLDAVRASSIGTALTLAPVFAATRLIADSIASLPLTAYRLSNGEKRPMNTPPALIATPTIYGTSYEWVQRALVSLLLRGNAYGLVTSVDNNGFPRQLEWLHPDDVQVKDNRSTSIPAWYWAGRPVDPWLGRNSTGQLVHIPWYAIPGEVLGLSPIKAFATTIESGIHAQRYGRDWFRDGGVPSAVLESEHAVDQEQAAIIKARFIAAASGRAPVVLGAGTSYKPIAVPPEESQFLETIKATASTIAAIYGVPPEMIGGESGGSLTYANVEQQSLNLVMHTLRPYLTKLEVTLSTLLPSPQYVQFNLNALLRADLKTRYQANKIALDPATGWMLLDEVRDSEELRPLTDAEKAELRPKTKPEIAPPQPDDAGNLPTPNQDSEANDERVIRLPRPAKEQHGTA